VGNLDRARSAISNGTSTTLRPVASGEPDGVLRARIETLTRLLQLASHAAASLTGSVPEQDRLHGAMVRGALDEALVELRLLSTALHD
jgi:hypothetical protein